MSAYKLISLIALLTCTSHICLNGQYVSRCGTEAPDEFYTHQVMHRSYPREEIVIPVVVHVVYTKIDENLSEERILSQIRTLNEDFNGNNIDITQVPKEFQKHVGKVGISFCLASEDPSGRPSNGMVRVESAIDSIGGQTQFETGRNRLKHSDLGGSNAWDTQRYLNIWVSNRIDGNIGKAIFPNEEAIDEEDGIEIFYKAFGPSKDLNFPFNKGRTLTHEVGHYLNLSHLWGRDEISCFDDGDMVDDTPSQSEIYFGCIDTPQFSCGSQDMTSNFMEFVDDACLNFFTKGQAERMMDALFRHRYELISSGICNTEPPVPNNPLDIAIIRQSSRGLLINLSFMPAVDYQLSLYSITGQLIWEERQNDLSIHLIDSNSYPTGIYVLQMVSENRQVAQKVLIANIN